MSKETIARLLAVVAAAFGLAYYSAFLDYGLNFDDEGTLLYQFERMSEGQRPYIDFHVGYTLGVYYLHGALQGLFDQSILPGRVALAIANAATMGGLAWLGAWAGAPVAGLLVAALYPALAVYSAGHFMTFNTPYPAWYAVALFLWAFVATARFAERPERLRPLVVAGLLAGVSFLFKPNVGLFAVAAAMLVALAATRPLARGWQLRWWGLVWVATLGGTLFVLIGATRPTDLLVLTGPAVVAALLVLRGLPGTAPDRTEDLGLPLRGARVAVSPWSASLALGLPFVLVNVPWLALWFTRMPLDRFLERVLFLGAGFEDFFRRAHQAPTLESAAIAFGFVIALVLVPPIARRARSTTLPVGALALAGLAAAAVLLAVLVAVRPMPQGLFVAISNPFEARLLPWTVGTMWGLLGLWYAGLKTDLPRPDFARAAVLTLGGVFLYLQIYPRTDIAHWANSAPLVLLAGATVVETWARFVMRKREAWERFALVAVLLAPMALALGARAGGQIETLYDVEGARVLPGPSVTLANQRAPIWVNAGAVARYDDLANVARVVREATQPEDRVFTFPALDLVNFLADRHGPGRDSYFFPGWFGRDDEARMIAAMERTKPPLAVVLHENYLFFWHAPVTYWAMTSYLERHYRPWVQVGRYAVLARNGAKLPAPPKAPQARSVAEALAEQKDEHPLARELLSEEAGVRLAALSRAHDLIVESSFAPIDEGLADPSASVRATALRAALRSRDGTMCTGKLQASVDEALPYSLRIRALRTLFTEPSPACVATLLNMTLGSDPVTVELARGLLGLIAHSEMTARFWPGRDAPTLPRLIPDSEVWENVVTRWFREPKANPWVKRFAFWIGDELDLYEAYADFEPSDLSLLLEETARREWQRRELAFELSLRGHSDAMLERHVGDLALDDTLAPRGALLAGPDNPRLDRALADAMTDDAPPQVRRRAAWLAAMTRGPLTDEALLRLARDEDEDLRKAAAWGLGVRGDEAHRGAIEALGSDPDSDVREFAALGLERLGAPALF